MTKSMMRRRCSKVQQHHGNRLALLVDARAVATPDGGLALVVHYRNTGLKPLYTFDRLLEPRPATTSSRTRDSRIASSTTTRSRSCSASRRLTRKMVLYQDVPYATKVEPGETISRRLIGRRLCCDTVRTFPRESARKTRQ